MIGIASFIVWTLAITSIYSGNNLCNEDTYTHHSEPARGTQWPIGEVLKLFDGSGQVLSIVVSQDFEDLVVVDDADGSDGSSSDTNEDQRE